MKIAFVNPPYKKYYSRSQRSPAVTKGGTLYYPYWLAYACGWAKKHTLHADLFDFVASNTPYDEAVAILKKERYSIVVIDTVTASVDYDTQFAEAIKKALPTSTILFVGTHVSARPDETLNHAAYVDAVAIGEYDQTIVDVANAIKKKIPLSTVPGLVIRKGTKAYHRTPSRPPLTPEQLDQFPFVSKIYKQYLDPRNYYFAASHYPMLMIITGRGCPFACNFCIYWQTLHGRVYRSRSAESVAQEFAYITKELPQVKEVVIEDDTFTANRKRVQDIARLLIKQHNRLQWTANVRVGIDLETLRLMKQAGCRLIVTGFESGDQKLLDAMGKHARVEQAYELMENTKKAGLLVHGCFMFGNPGETRETMKKTLVHAMKLNPDSAQFYPLFVYPGTVSYAWFEKHHYLKTTDYSMWLKANGEHNTIIELPNLTSGEIVRFCEQAYPKYLFRSKYILYKLQQLWTNPKESLRSFHSLANYFRTRYILR